MKKSKKLKTTYIHKYLHSTHVHTYLQTSKQKTHKIQKTQEIFIIIQLREKSSQERGFNKQRGFYSICCPLRAFNQYRVFAYTHARTHTHSDTNLCTLSMHTCMYVCMYLKQANVNTHYCCHTKMYFKFKVKILVIDTNSLLPFSVVIPVTCRYKMRTNEKAANEFTS